MADEMWAEGLLSPRSKDHLREQHHRPDFVRTERKVDLKSIALEQCATATLQSLLGLIEETVRRRTGDSTEPFPRCSFLARARPFDGAAL